MPGSNINRRKYNEHQLTASKDSYVMSYAHLKGRPNEEKAIPMLQKIASLVKPIMRKHGWTLPLLAEFYPDNPGLLDVNGGQKILLRLRPAHAPSTFYDEDHLVGTMLHELTHNVHGPHDDKFYKFLAGLETEYDELQRSGYSGEGFFSKGARVGEGVSHDLPPHLARLKALEAAEKRRRTAALTSGSGSRLGGRKTAKTPRELAAEAAERRARDQHACGQDKYAEAEAEKAIRDGEVHQAIDLPPIDSTSRVIDIDSSDDDQEGPSIGDPLAAASTSKANLAQNLSGLNVLGDLDTNPAAKRQRTRHYASRFSQAHPTLAPQALSSPLAPSAPPVAPESGEWPCVVCTYLNAPLSLQCEVCFAQKSVRLAHEKGWMWIDDNFWSCGSCGWVKITS
ncbi:hypothetical protein BS47DRAFT_1372117 [Hydnum rufescens UP504]|uniref:WLM-domain-containing protein n=1 Tax=Hydnum rufescens UP504 TaxID=1448309 RepID=A0A9P6DYN9_9AGAM|nr:hypothetical protein BS47DRAFT_1372117 [Hydnum rufescens UP504]